MCEMTESRLSEKQVGLMMWRSGPRFLDSFAVFFKGRWKEGRRPVQLI